MVTDDSLTDISWKCPLTILEISVRLLLLYKTLPEYATVWNLNYKLFFKVSKLKTWNLFISYWQNPIGDAKDLNNASGLDIYGNFCNYLTNKKPITARSWLAVSLTSLRYFPVNRSNHSTGC